MLSIAPLHPAVALASPGGAAADPPPLLSAVGVRHAVSSTLPVLLRLLPQSSSSWRPVLRPLLLDSSTPQAAGRQAAAGAGKSTAARPAAPALGPSCAGLRGSPSCCLENPPRAGATSSSSSVSVSLAHSPQLLLSESSSTAATGARRGRRLRRCCTPPVPLRTGPLGPCAPLRCCLARLATAAPLPASKSDALRDSFASLFAPFNG